MPSYYEILEVSQSASPDEIKQSFHRLAHIYHPDKPTGNQGKFISILKAYEVLSDSSERSLYDLSLEPQNQKPARERPYAAYYSGITCHICGRTSPLKRVKLLQNIGLFLVRKTRTIEGSLCKECINKYFAQFTITTLLLGWWGVVSFFVTPFYLLNNLKTFLSSTKLRSEPRNKNGQELYAWSVFCVTIVIFLALALAIINSPASSGSYESSSSLNLPSPSVQIQTPISLDRKLTNGMVLAQGTPYMHGQGVLTVSNGTENDAVLKLVSSNGGLAYYVYISAHDNFTINKISDGSYRVLYSSGSDWNGNGFTQNQNYSVFDDALDFETTTYSDSEYIHTKYTTYTLTLDPQIDGNAKTDSVDSNTFNAYR